LTVSVYVTPVESGEVVSVTAAPSAENAAAEQRPIALRLPRKGNDSVFG